MLVGDESLILLDPPLNSKNEKTKTFVNGLSIKSHKHRGVELCQKWTHKDTGGGVFSA